MLPVFSVGDEEEAHRLLVASCPTNADGAFIDPFTAKEQTLENLERFSELLEERHVRLVEAGWCRCEQPVKSAVSDRDPVQ